MLLEVKRELYATDSESSTEHGEAAAAKQQQWQQQQQQASISVAVGAGVPVNAGKPVSLRGPNGAFSVILPQQMLAPMPLAKN